MIRHSNDNIPRMGDEAEELLTGLTLDFVRTEFTLPQRIAKECDPYFLRMWHGVFVHSCVHEGTLPYNGHSYIVHWQSTPEVVRNSEKVACSFRGYKDKRYVVIKAWKQTEQGQGEL